MSTIYPPHLSQHEMVTTVIDRSQVAVVVPTYNARGSWDALNSGLQLQGLPANQVLIVDSSSDDGTSELARAQGYQVVRIERRDFNHGGTRKLAVGLVPWAEIVVYLTQDAILAKPDSLDRLLSAFEDERVAAAYGRQLPRPRADPIETHARLFNYPPQSDVRDFESRHKLGIKAAFMSNSFSAYRVRELQMVGGFPSDVIIAEDALVAGRLLMAGWKTAYVAEAEVYHSHSFTVAQEFRRYFDIGVCHRREAWLRQQFGKAGREGERFVRSELSYLWRHDVLLLPAAILRTITKALGYQLGLHGSWLGTAWSKRLSFHKSFWAVPSDSARGNSEAASNSKLPRSGEAPLS